MMTQVVLAINETVLVQFAKDFFLVKAHVDKIMLPSTYPRYGAVAFATMSAEIYHMHIFGSQSEELHEPVLKNIRDGVVQLSKNFKKNEDRTSFFAHNIDQQNQAYGDIVLGGNLPSIMSCRGLSNDDENEAFLLLLALKVFDEEKRFINHLGSVSANRTYQAIRDAWDEKIK